MTVDRSLSFEDFKAQFKAGLDSLSLDAAYYLEPSWGFQDIRYRIQLESIPFKLDGSVHISTWLYDPDLVLKGIENSINAGVTMLIYKDFGGRFYDNKRPL